MTLDSLIGWILTNTITNTIITIFGASVSIIYIITYMVAPTILVILLILMLEKSELKKVFSKLF